MKINFTELMETMNPEQRKIFAKLTKAYLSGEITKEQLRACYDDTDHNLAKIEANYKAITA